MLKGVVTERFVLKEIRESRGISQKDLAELIGCIPASICNYEAGRSSPNGKNLKKLAEMFEIAISDLFQQEIQVETFVKLNKGKLEVVVPNNIIKLIKDGHEYKVILKKVS